MNVDENTQADDPVGTVRVHPEDDRMSPTARRRIAVDASDYCGPYEGCRWQRLTGVGIGDGGCDPLHSRDVAGWPVQPLAELAVVLGHPAVDGDLRERIVDAVLDVLAHGDVATQQEGSERLADVMLAIVRPVLERRTAEIADHWRAAGIDEGTKAELAEENAGLCAEVARLAAELASERAVYADSPGDRLWHDADQTWWRRAEDGRLVHGEAPLEVERLTRERDEARAEAEGFYSATRRLASMFWLDPEVHQTLDVLGSIAEQLAAWRADAAQVPEGWQSLVCKGWSVGASRPAIPADAEKQLNYLLVRACNAEPLEFQPLAEARKLLVAWSVPASGSGIKPSWFGRTCSGCGSHVAAREPEGVGDVLCTQCHPGDLPLTIGSDTTADGPKRQWTDSTGIVWQEAQPGFVHVVSPMTGQPHMFGEPVELEKVEAKFGPLTAAVPTPNTDTTEVPGA